MTSAPLLTSLFITRLTLFSLPGMGLAEIMTMSLGRMSSFLCSENAMRLRPLMGSPWEPVVSTTISRSGYLSMSSMSTSSSSGMSRYPSWRLMRTTDTMLLPTRHSLRP